MSFPRYENYKVSGVEWLGDVPSGWSVKRVKHLFEIKKRISGDKGYEVLSITQQGIKVKDIESGDGQLSMDYSKYQFVEIGDFAMNHMDLLTGYVDISSFFGVTSPDYRVFCVRDKEVCFDKYYLYLFQMGYRNKIFYAFGQGSSQLGRWRFPTEQFNSFELPSPPIKEQKRIAAFLDRETAKIDALIAEKQRLVALLVEKRQAAISHAVTKGLNPNATMKNSGIAWLGEMPEHWQVKKTKYLLKRDGYKAGPFGSSLITSELLDYGDILVLSPEHIAESSFDLPANLYLPKERRHEMAMFAVSKGDVVLPIVGTLGRAMVINSDIQAIMNQRLARISPDSGKLLPEYLRLLLTDFDLYKKLDDLDSKGAIINHITKEIIINRIVPLPPTDEQLAILSFLDRETAKFDALTLEANHTIALLQERRMTLISAAVTGKIDVRYVTERDAA